MRKRDLLVLKAQPRLRERRAGAACGSINRKNAMATTGLTMENFEETVTQNEMFIIDFWAPWCGLAGTR